MLARSLNTNVLFVENGMLKRMWKWITLCRPAPFVASKTFRGLWDDCS